MEFTRSIKTDPFGVMDTRVTTDTSADDILPVSSLSFIAQDGATEEPMGMMEAETNPKRDYRILEFRKPFSRFDPNRNFPRLELDAAVDRYHLLDGLNGPSNPQNTPASNTERESTPEPGQCNPGHLQTSAATQIEEFHFDCFQDEPTGGFFADQGDGNYSPRPSKLRCLPGNQNRWFQAPANDSKNCQAAMNPRSPMKSVMTSPATRCVRFSPAPSISPTRAMRRPMPSIERKRDYISLYRQKKQCEKWKVTRRTIPQRASPSPKPAIHCPKTRDQKDDCARSSSITSLLLRQVDKFRGIFPSVSKNEGVEPKPSTAWGTPVTRDANFVPTNEQKQLFVNVSFSLYKLREAPHGSAGKVPTYAFDFQTIETDITSLPEHGFPQFPCGFEHTIGPVTVEDLVFHTCFLVSSLSVRLPLATFYAVIRHLTDTQAGNVMLHIARFFLSLLAYVAALVFSLCGVTFNCQWFSEPSNPD